MTLYSRALTPRITDINYGNHLGHIELLGLIHEARFSFIRSLKKDATELNFFGCSLVANFVEMQIIQETNYGEELLIELSVAEKTKTSFVLSYIVTRVDKNTVVAQVRTRLVCLSPKTKKPVRIPEAFLAHLSI